MEMMTQRPLFALLIGINRYASTTVPDLAGCENDVLALRSLLQEHFGVPTDTITMLLNEAATREAIHTAFRERLLAPLQAWRANHPPAQDASEQPAILFYFSGHGSQAPATDKPAGLDETLVPHDSRTNGVFDIRDRELRLWLAELTKYTTNVTVILDCCHSGSGTRLDKKQITDVRACPLDERPQPPLTTLLPVMRSALAPTPPIDHLNHVLLAACRNDEKAREETFVNQRHGIFTYWLLEFLRQQPFHQPLTYLDLYNQVRYQLQRTYGNDAQRAQTPQCEGDRDRLFLGDLRPVRSRWLTVVDEREGLIWVDSGQAQGLSVGTVLHLYPPETTTPTEAPVAILQVDVVAAVESGCIRLDPQPWAPIPRGARALVHSYGKNRPRIKVALDFPDGLLLNAVRERLVQPDIYPEIALALLNESATLRLSKEGDSFVIQRGDRQQIYQRYDSRQLNPYRRPLVAKDLDPVVRDLLHLVKQAQVGAIAGEPGAEIVAALRVTLERLLPKAKNEEMKTAPLTTDAAGILLLPVDAPFVLRITNGYAKPLYITVLALGCRGDVRRVYPEIAGANEAVATGKTLTITQTNQPQRQLPADNASVDEQFKIIATTQEANFDYLLQDELPSHPQADQVFRSGQAGQPRTLSAFPRVSDIFPEEQWGAIDVPVRVVRTLSAEPIE
jgi:hypothetical protein